MNNFYAQLYDLNNGNRYPNDGWYRTKISMMKGTKQEFIEQELRLIREAHRIKHEELKEIYEYRMSMLKDEDEKEKLWIEFKRKENSIGGINGALITNVSRFLTNKTFGDKQQTTLF